MITKNLKFSKKTVILIICVICLAFTNSFGQNQRLKPARNFKESVSKNYRGVFPLLYKGFAKKPYARYTAMPSFSREYAFSVEKIKGVPYIISNTLSTNYYFAKVKIFVKIKKNKAKISDDLYLKIGELFEIFTEQTEDKDFSGLDGVTYYFAKTGKNGEIKTGETWSPDENSLLDRLVNICIDLYLIGNNKDIAQTDILKEIDIFINDLKELK